MTTRKPPSATSVDVPSPFLDQSRWIRQNRHAAALRDLYPVSPGHTLVVPKRLVRTLFDLSEEEILACWRLLSQERNCLEEEFEPDGFNIGVNDGAAAGQSVGHAHIHLIPRFEGDDPDPIGGVRRVVRGKARY